MTNSNSAISLPVRGYSALTCYSTGLQSLVLLVFRLSFGWKTYLSGFRHLHSVPAMAAQFKDWGIPYPTFNVYVSGTTELIGGLLLMAGLMTRLISIPLVFNFCVAIATAGRDSLTQLFKGGQILSEKFYSAGRLSGLEAVIDDTAFPFLMLALVMLAFGPGKISIDYLLQRTLFKKAAPKPG